MYLKSYTPDTASMLAAIAGRIQELSIPVNLYLDHIRGDAASNECWERLGIYPVLSNIHQQGMDVERYWPIVNSKTSNTVGRWNSFKNDTVIEGLKTLISDCSVIRFTDWTKTDDASGWWYGLFADVIKRLNKRDLEFLFHPGDVSKKLVFEVDELLDIMSDYSSYGRVTLVLGEEEADQLWKRLNGRASYATSVGFRSPDAREKHLFLFNTMSIDVLLIQDDNRTVLLSRDGQLDLAGRPILQLDRPRDSREYFYAGYELGLLLHLEVPHCVALGHAVAGVTRMPAARLDSKALFTYIKDWMADLHPDEVLQQSI